MTHPAVEIAGRRIAADQPPYDIAELSAKWLFKINRVISSVATE